MTETAAGLLLGATRGTGRVLSEAWAARGWPCLSVGRRDPQPDWAGGPVCLADLTEADAPARIREAFSQRWSQLNSLVFFQRYRGPRENSWQGEWQVGLTATQAILDEMLPLFAPTGGSVVLVGSTASTQIAEEQPVGSHLAKAAMLQFVRFHAVALGPRQIRVNLVSPATVIKPESSEFYRGQPELVAQISRATPLGRMGTSSDVAQAIDFLCSPSASFITAQNLQLDGGLSALSPLSVLSRISQKEERAFETPST